MLTINHCVYENTVHALKKIGTEISILWKVQMTK